MDQKFAEIVETLHPKFEQLLGCPVQTNGLFKPKLPLCGVYLFSQGPKHLYVGRSNKLRNRYGGHTRNSSKHYSAPFAFKLACEATQRSYLARDRAETRDELMLDEEFKSAFDAAKRKILAMDYRFVQEDDPVRQALLESYCCIVLNTPYNDFDTH